MVLLLAACASFGTAVTFSQSVQRLEAYDFVEITASVPSPGWGNPFTLATLSGFFETVDGSRRWPIEGFCDSEDGSIFRIRFMPPTPGAYRYSIAYQKGLFRTESTGSFQVIDGHRRGPVRVDPQHRFHFVWEGTGEHYFFNGTTAYWLVGWRDDGIIQSSIERLHKLKINRIRVTIAGRSGQSYGEAMKVGPRWTTYPTPWPAANPDDLRRPGFDYRRFHVAYWQKFERALRIARDRDVIISLVLDMNDSRVHPNAGSWDETRFIRYAVARFAAFSNITWDLGDDLDAYRGDDWARLTGTLLKAWDPYGHLATSHPIDNVHQDRTADWFDFTSFQEWSRDQHAFMLRQRREQIRLGRIIPQTNEEYGYEDHRPPWSPRLGFESADDLRRTAWDIVMAGGYQTTGESARRGTNVPPDTGGGWLNGRGDDTMTMLQGYAHMVDFFTSFEWWKAEPRDDLVSDGAYCLAILGSVYAVYLPRGGQTTIQLHPGSYEASWFDPRTGRTVVLPPIEGSAWTSPRSPDDKDWALLLRRK